MNKIYYFYVRDSGECFFFNDEECAKFYKFMLNTDCSKIKSLNIKNVSFDGTDVFTLSSFKEKILKEFSINLYLNSYGQWNLIDFLSKLDAKIRDEKIIILLNE